MWVSEDIDPSYLVVYTLTLKDHQPNTMLLKSRSQSNYLKVFIESFKIGKVFYENMNVKNITYEAMKMFIS